MSLEINELINILTQASPVKRPLRLGLCACAWMVFSAVMTVIILGLRPELIAAHPPLSFWVKTGLLLALLIVNLRALNAASKPIAKDYVIWPIALLIIVTSILVINEWLTTDHQTIIDYFMVRNFPSCLLFVTLYGALGMVILTLLMRHYAPANIKRSAGLIGLVAAAAGAMGYSIHCPFDSPTFIVIAYGLPSLAMWLMGRKILPRFIKW